MPTTTKFKYIMFTHLQSEKSWDALKEHAKPLGKCLASESAEGMLVAFYDEGWLPLLNSIGIDSNPVDLQKGLNNVDRKEEIIEEIIEKEPRLEDRLRLITAKDLFPIINNLRGNKPGKTATQLKQFLVGEQPDIRYDTTKIVEAIIRIRHLGSGIPVMRMDWDALLNEKSLESHIIAMTHNMTNYCKKIENESSIHSYILNIYRKACLLPANPL